MIEANKLTLPTRQPRKSRTPKRIVFLFILLMVGLAVYLNKSDVRDFLFEADQKKPIAQKLEQQQPLVEEITSQEFNVESPAEQDLKVTTANLDNSDLSVEDEISDKFNTPLWLGWFGGEHIIRKTATFIDNASRGELAREVLSLPIPNQSLELIDDKSYKLLDQQNYDQYNVYMKIVSAIRPEVIDQLYTKFKPLLEHAYTELGNPNKRLDQALSEAFQIILDTPEIKNQAMVERIGGRTMFADEKIENLPDIQKLLIRMGAKNRAVVKQKVVQLKALMF